MGVATWMRTLFTGQDPTAYKSTIDGNFAVLERLSAYFAASQSSTPNMTVTIRAGAVFASGTLTEVAQQITTTITAPAVNPRIDRVVLDQVTGIYTIVTGTPAGSPVAPSIPAGKIPCCQILLQTTSTTIVNSMITDERVAVVVSGGAGSWVIKTANYTAVNGDTIAANTTGGVFSITLPASPSTNASVSIVDYGGTFATNNLTVARNGSNIMGLAEDMTVGQNFASIHLVYIDSTRGWLLV